MFGKYALFILVTLSQIVSDKPEELISHICGWVNGSTAIAVARLYFHMICDDCLPGPLRDRGSDWYLGLVPGLEQLIACQNSFTHTLAQNNCHRCDPALPLICESLTLSLYMDQSKSSVTRPRTLQAQ